MDRYHIPLSVLECMNRIEQNGYEAWLAGGCVRDLLRGETPEDYDIASSAPPEKILKIFDRVIETGIRHGTVTVMIGDFPIEVTRFRVDGEYRDHRHPETVIPVDSIEEDLARRDFTVNAMAMNLTGELKDPFGGRADLKSKLVRAVGDPDTRFSEDALRILRGFRFASVLEYTIEEKTLEAALRRVETLSNISAERIFGELIKCMLGAAPQSLEPLINAGGLLSAGISSGRKLELLAKIPPECSLRFAALCYLSDANPETVLRRLKSDKQISKLSAGIINELRLPAFVSKAEMKTRLSGFPPQLWKGIIETRGVLLGEDIAECKAWLTAIMDHNEPYLLRMLDIDGFDLIKLGFKGEKIGEALEKLLGEVIVSPELNRKKILLRLVEKHL